MMRCTLVKEEHGFQYPEVSSGPAALRADPRRSSTSKSAHSARVHGDPVYVGEAGSPRAPEAQRQNRNTGCKTP